MRDAALRRLSLAKRWILAVSLALTGALVGLAANAFPGKTLKTPGSASGATSEQGAAGSSSSSEGSSSSLTPAEQAPQSAEEPESGSPAGEQESQPAVEAPVVSGGS